MTQFPSYASSFRLYKSVSEQYNDQSILNSVKRLIPEKVLHLIADDQNLKPLLHWFKNGFMKWMPKELQCIRCNNRPMSIQLVDPIQEHYEKQKFTYVMYVVQNKYFSDMTIYWGLQRQELVAVANGLYFLEPSQTRYQFRLE